MMKISDDEILVNVFFTNENKSQIQVIINSESGTRVENILVGSRKYNDLLERHIDLSVIHQNTIDRLKFVKARTTATAKAYADAEGYIDRQFLELYELAFDDVDSEEQRAELFKMKLDALLFSKSRIDDPQIRKRIKRCTNGRAILQTLLDVIPLSS